MSERRSSQRTESLYNICSITSSNTERVQWSIGGRTTRVPVRFSSKLGTPGPSALDFHSWEYRDRYTRLFVSRSTLNIVNILW